MTNKHEHTNRLIHESSPYLLQHAHNPVDWHAWNEETLAKAKRENKPMLVSIGYSACHWCHVMERESFEDEEVAEVMNEKFICIKVDREERPDVDQVYMDAVQMISGSGGWPLNCFALPDGKPFWGGTYFPREQWLEILKNIAELYAAQKQRLLKQAGDLTEWVGKNPFEEAMTGDLSVNRKMMDGIVGDIVEKIDKDHGGFGSAPKFPMPGSWSFLLQYAYRKNDQELIRLITLTLDKMASGGIYDQIGGGFARYSVDSRWHIPHFEKMLYDNAQLTSLYAEAYSATGNPCFKEILTGILRFIEREMAAEEGGFYSSIDADSEGEEGKFYTWTEKEFADIAGKHAPMAMEYFGIGKQALWEHGKNIPVRAVEIAKLSEEFELPENLVRDRLEKIRAELLKRRSERIPPSRDEKILTSWNALMIRGYLDAHRSSGDQHYLETAVMHMEFLLGNLTEPGGGVFHQYKEGRASVPGFLEDYALLSDALIRMYEETLEERWLNEAQKLIEYALAHFFDKDSVMFYFTHTGRKDQIVRKMEITDHVIPSSNAVMASALFRLSLLSDRSGYHETAKKMLGKMQQRIARYPLGFYEWGKLVLNEIYPYYTAVVTGRNAMTTLKSLNRHYLPHALRAGSAGSSEVAIVKNRVEADSTRIYVCSGNECKLPVESVEAALPLLSPLH